MGAAGPRETYNRNPRLPSGDVLYGGKLKGAPFLSSCVCPLRACMHALLAPKSYGGVMGFQHASALGEVCS